VEADAMIVIHCSSEPRPVQGHYFACEACGWCSKVKYGPDSRLEAVLAGRSHRECKREFVLPTVRENTKPGMTPREARRQIRTA
jgi:hypothetical protein